MRSTYESAHIAKATLENETIAMRDKGLSANDIVQRIEDIKKKVIIYAMIENLDKVLSPLYRRLLVLQLVLMVDLVVLVLDLLLHKVGRLSWS